MYSMDQFNRLDSIANFPSSIFPASLIPAANDSPQENNFFSSQHSGLFFINSLIVNPLPEIATPLTQVKEDENIKIGCGPSRPVELFGKQVRHDFDAYHESSSESENESKKPKTREERHAIFNTPEFKNLLSQFEGKTREERPKLPFFASEKDKEVTKTTGYLFSVREFVRKLCFKSFSNKRYCCKFCPISFTSKGGIGGHMSRVHGAYAKRKQGWSRKL